MAARKIVVTSDELEPVELSFHLSKDAANGAEATFVGRCRDEDGNVAALELEHYPSMAEAQLDRIASAAAEKFKTITSLVVAHRYGVIRPGEVIVFVGATSPHRDAAFDAVRMVMDYLKTEAPFWKKEHLAHDQGTRWLEQTK
ncbi:MAG: molybdenum cofactor biosynthesis protein MoaE [Pseudomonadota bacterium]